VAHGWPPSILALAAVWDHGSATGKAVVVYASIRKYRHIRSPEQIAHRVEKGFVPILKSLCQRQRNLGAIGGSTIPH